MRRNAVRGERPRKQTKWSRAKLYVTESLTRQDGLRLAFTPAVVLFIALPETENNTDPG